ncbi:haloacid dehalogenase-like hydrolase [Alsobacter sp. SYSU M60028]|uniref:Haloacid dehalogenase-like hydrolase n=1 Tax=Alsobacter ponti TaxID=2962936 RepID=A0ABT1L990_9HYPH|nr:HAD family hydrolase [Alsobacter ponti]MCP8937310.1 haloacid dehalogenase-like hydrolase [Alsobacter ponti]
MFRSIFRAGLALALVAFAALAPASAQTADPLASWNDGPAKKAIVDFVAAVTTPGGPDFVPPAERIATFDNDGTLWPEQPVYTQLVFALDRIKALAPANPDWKDKQPFKAVLEGDMAALMASGERGGVELLMASHAGMTAAEFSRIVEDWIAKARHPRFDRPYTDLAYKPMVELMAYLRANGFKTYIVSGGGVEFMRPWTERVYGVPTEQVIGSIIKTRFQMRDGRPELFRLPQVEFIDDGPGKPVGIAARIGARPIAAFGNSDGDIEMLQWATMSGRRGLGMLIHHTDAGREYAYDNQAQFGGIAKALEAAAVNRWTVVSMKDDWKTIFAFDK